MNNDAASLVNATSSAPIVLACEHASSFIPTSFADLGLHSEHRLSHAVWDIGAQSLARQLSEHLNAPLVESNLSRLVYDCNRPIHEPSAVPARSENIPIPGNENLNAEEIQARHQLAYVPFEALLRKTIDTQIERCGNEANAASVALITIHTFTPTYYGEKRTTELGFIHDANSELTETITRLSQQTTTFKTAMNEPYDQSDGVTHTLKVHATARGIHNVMIEVKNDLLLNETSISAMALTLKELIELSISAVVRSEKPKQTGGSL